ncbi:SHOCT domain-containing protein [Streptomyces sp. NRRL S-87]|uniref:SHOCT domain-containing protein n=1 Tax=Streptomyces sp. NRRL S-87 TaxID=1463920 RepID=UPI0004BF2C07|nr:SHOCT domain-containing protein [Streptomyces sp. NRRL S-87]
METQFLAYDYPLLGAFWTVMWIFLWVLWFILLFHIIVDIFRDHGLSGWAKAGWLILIIVLPFLGVLIYVIARGKSMSRRQMEDVRDQKAAMDEYIRATAGSSTADQLDRLSKLKDSGDITPEEYERAKAKLLR